MEFELRILSSALRALSELPPGQRLAGVCALLIIAHLWRRTRYLTAGWRRERALRLSERRAHTTQLVETVKTLNETFSKAPAPRLRDLANNTADDFELKS